MEAAATDAAERDGEQSVVREAVRTNAFSSYPSSHSSPELIFLAAPPVVDGAIHCVGGTNTNFMCCIACCMNPARRSFW